MRLQLLRLPLALLLVACGVPTALAPVTGDGPLLEVTTGIVAPGAIIEVRQTNESTESFGYGVPCNWSVERQNGNIWTTVIDSRAGACLTMVYTMPPGVVEVRRFSAPAAEGTYRVRMYWNGPDGNSQTVSNTFVISATGPVLMQPLQTLVDPGTEMQVRFSNLVANEWGFNTCSGGRMEYLHNEVWVQLPEPLALCTTELVPLAANAEMDVTVAVPIGAVAGTYRYTQRFDRTGAGIRVASTIFNVR